MKPDSLNTYLSSKGEGLAEGIEKKDDHYIIKVGWMNEASFIVEEALEKERET